MKKLLYIKIADRYLLRQYFTAFLFMLFMVMTISIVIDVVEKLDDFIEKKTPMKEIIFDYYANFVPYWGNMLSPICIYLSVIYFTSRMAGRSELIPLMSGGVSYYRILGVYLLASCLLAGSMFVVKSYVIPPATAKRLEFEYKYFKKKRISSTSNIHKKVAPDTYVYFNYFNERIKEGNTFSMEKVVNGDVVFKLQARKIVWVDSTQSWRMTRVNIRRIDKLKETLQLRASMDTTFLLTPDDIYIKEQKAESMTLPQLLEYIRLEEMRGSDILSDLYIERHRRFTDPFAIIVLTIIGFAMSSRKVRGGVALQIGLGLLMAFLYIVLLFAGQALIGDSFPAGLAVWLPNLIFLPVSLILVRMSPK
jgi:lipopolysaccharide export system permease protein